MEKKKREDSSSFTRHLDSSSLQSHQSSRQAAAADSSIPPPPSLSLAACTTPAAASRSAAAAGSPPSPAAASPSSPAAASPPSPVSPPSPSPAAASQDHPFASPPATASPSAAAGGGSSSFSSSSSPAAGLSPAAFRTAAGVVDVSASFAAAAAATMHLPSVNSEVSSLGTQSSLLHHPRPPNLLLSETGGVSLLPAAATNFRSFSSSSPFSAISEAALSGAAAAAVPSRLALPPILPPAPWLWDSSLLDAFAAPSQQPAAAAALAVATAAAGGGEAGAGAAGEGAAAGAAAAGGRRRSDSNGELLVPVATAGENPPGAPTAALFLLPTGGGSILRLEEAYVCENCCAIRAPEELSVEIEAYYCPNCFDSLTQTEALACGCSCTKCFDCPRCCASLSVMRQPREAAEAAKGRSSEISYVVSRSLSTRSGGVKQGVGGTAAAATANQAEAVVRRLLFEAGRRTSSSSSSKEGDSEGEGRDHLSEEAGLLAAAAPQRCESLLSLSSDEDDNSDQEEGQQQLTPAAAERSGVGGKGGSLLALNESSSSSSIAEEDNLDENKRKQQQEQQQQRERKRERSHRKEHRYLYYFSCPYCRWNSKALQIISDSSALLPAAAIAEERAGGLLHRYFHQVLDVLQRAARDRERLRQLEARVKHKAVALLFAAAAAHDKRRVHAQLQPARGKSDDADATTTTAAAAGTAETEAGATAAGVGEQLLLSGGGVSGSSKSWRVTDVEQTLAQRAAAQNSFAHAGEAWATAYRSELQQPPQYVELQQLLRGEHTVQQKQQEEEEEEGTVMTDVMFGWQLQQHEAAQLLKRSRGAAREGPDGETRSRDNALQEHHHLLEGTGERRRKSSIDVTLETPVAIPLHSPQLLLDRASPDSPPLKLPSQRLPGTLLYTKIHPAQASSNSSSNILRSKSENITTDTGKNTIQEWWTAEQATLEQRLRHPNSLIAAATSTSLLRPTRKKLLTRESKRCRVCARYLVKAHVSSIAVPPFRVNSAAALLLPWIVPQIDRRSGQLSRTGDLADVRLNLLNPTDAPLRLKFHFRHGTPPASAALTGLHLKRHHRREGTSSFIQAAQGQEEGDAVARTHSPLVIDDKGGSIKVLSRAAAGATGGPTGSDVSLSGAAAVKTLDSLAFVTAAEAAGTSLEAEEESSGGLHRRREAATTSRVQSADWETVEIVTPDFELQLDRYDEMLGEFGEYDVISRSSKGSGSHDEDFRSRSASVAAVEWKKGNTAQVRLQVRAKESVSEEPEEQQQQQQPAICCVTIDVETMALQSNTLRVQYLLFLGHLRVPTTEKA